MYSTFSKITEINQDFCVIIFFILISCKLIHFELTEGNNVNYYTFVKSFRNSRRGINCYDLWYRTDL